MCELFALSSRLPTEVWFSLEAFSRRGGLAHVFAHNGDLDPARLRARLPLGAYRPIGEADSEYAFCARLK